jgi:hypothetical protein
VCCSRNAPFSGGLADLLARQFHVFIYAEPRTVCFPQVRWTGLSGKLYQCKCWCSAVVKVKKSIGHLLRIRFKRKAFFPGASNETPVTEPLPKFPCAKANRRQTLFLEGGPENLNEKSCNWAPVGGGFSFSGGKIIAGSRA